MKKLCALLLSVIMAAFLTVPAFADGPDGPPTPADLGIIGGADGPTSIITSNPFGGGQNWMNTNPKFDDMDRQTYQAMLDEMKKSLGGVPGQIGVMVNGAYIKFPDAAPEVTNGRTMVPVRALVETLGGEVDYQDDVVTFALDGYTYKFAIGSTTVEVNPTADNDKDTPKPEDIEMDCVPYIKGGRTYVPIRFISEALGYEVGWDNTFETAILLDRDALAAEIDKDFTILNRVQAARTPALEEGKGFRQDLKGNAAVTIFDTLNGNKTYKVDLTGKTLLNSEAASGTYSLTLSDNIVDLFLEQYGYMEEDELELMRTVLKGLKDMQVIMTEEGKLWVHASALDEVSGEKNAWCGVDVGAEFGKAIFSSVNVATMGTAIAAVAEVNSVTGWSQMMEAAKFMSDMYGDKCFTTSGGTSTRTISLEELADLAGVDADEVKDAFKEFKLVMKVDSKGGATVTCKMETAAQSGIPSMKLTMDCTQSGGKADLTMTLHVANLGEGKLTLTTAQQTTSEKPMSEPPAGASIVDLPADAPAPLNP